MSEHSLSAAFHGRLKALGLTEFPCGIGTWNKSHFESGGSKKKSNPDWEEKDEKELLPNTLTELLRTAQSPWHHKDDWSLEERQLKELAVHSPEAIEDSFVFSYFRSLRFVDKGVTIVDEGLLKFCKLEELTLSVNYISEVNAAHLPRSLKVLELCANHITSLEALCQGPPALFHLGLGYNRLSSPSEYSYLTSSYWPNLLSLDLSFNDLDCLPALVSSLRTVGQLRCLVLQGNPVALCACYRGFLVDSLPNLTALDDIRITPEERNRFAGLIKREDLPLAEAVMIIKMGSIKGLPNPVCQPDADSASAFPLVSFSYRVTYELLCSRPPPSRCEQKTDESHDGTALDTSKMAEVATVQAENTVAMVEKNGKDAERQTDSEENGKGREHQVGIEKNQKSPEQERDTEKNGKGPVHGGPSPVPVDVHITEALQWATVMDTNYRREHVIQDLAALKKFFSGSLQVSLVEEKVLAWPVSPSAAETAPLKSSSAKKGGDRDKSAKGKQKDKKKEPPLQLRYDPPILQTLGSVTIKLDSFLTGEQHLDVICDMGILMSEPPVEPPAVKDIKQEGKKVKEEKKKDDKKTPKAGRGSPGSSKSTGSAKTKGKAKESSMPELKEESLASSPVPLSVPFHMQLFQWQTAADVESGKI
ncbi:leucine-rich repeat-containing protein 43-like isoform X1 [Polypterus senegalus]|uniref:leucine-rich repeat-containing protein 43-like isoform X1 n=1 Tax=Polypterus senegalus TaxID=55291 RepID=UPI0019653A60|nr:leucine-rich repeat-containing protein 43-like isoform X1 [Polypterus senegalus]